MNINDPEKAGEILKKFGEMISRAEKITKSRDPLKEVLEDPRDWGVGTDSSKIDEIVYA